VVCAIGDSAQVTRFCDDPPRPMFLTKTTIACLIAVVFGACVGGASTRTRVAGRRPTVTVVPRMHLRDGQIVTAYVTGFGDGEKVWLSECASIAVAGDEGCGQQLPQQTLLVTEAHGAGSTRFTVHSRAAWKPYSPGATKGCARSCVIVATEGGLRVWATEGIRFGR
jgi:hypothetical protein